MHRQMVDDVLRQREGREECVYAAAPSNEQPEPQDRAGSGHLVDERVVTGDGVAYPRQAVRRHGRVVRRRRNVLAQQIYHAGHQLPAAERERTVIKVDK